MRSLHFAIQLAAMVFLGTAAGAQQFEPHTRAADIASIASAPAVLFVSPAGRDANNGGSPTQAFASVEKARDAARAIKLFGKHRGPIVIEIASGEYERLAPLELGAADSGTAQSPIIYRAAKGADVRIVGGKRVRQWKPVTDAALIARLDPNARGHVLQADLRAIGIADAAITKSGGTRLVYQDKALTVARWPNEGYAKVGELKGGSPIDVRGDKGDAVGKFTYEGDRPDRWIGDNNVWLHGYWFWDWGDERQRVESVDPKTRIISLAKPDHTYGYRTGQWYYAYNALSELDRPGEYVIDSTTGTAFLWPTEPMSNDWPTAAVASSLIAMTDVSNVVFAGLTLEHCVGHAVRIKGGSDNLIVGATIRHAGGWAVQIDGGQRHGVSSSNIYSTGEGGVRLSGGDRATLTAANHFADNNHIHHYAMWTETYQPAVWLGGVGSRATHNLIHDAPHQAIAFEGNDHVIDFNSIHHVCLKSNDAGAIYSGRDWTWRGTVIRHNYLHDIQGLNNKMAVGVYLDDLLSEVTIYGNVFRNVRYAAFIGGGRDTVVENNVFIDCEPAVHVDSRGTGWAAFSVPETMIPRLNQMPYQNDLWRARYPRLPDILNDRPAMPIGNRVARNICVGGTWMNLADGLTDQVVTLDSNFMDGPPNLVNPAEGDYTLRPDAPALKTGFKPIPFDRMGLYRNEFRADVPRR